MFSIKDWDNKVCQFNLEDKTVFADLSTFIEQQSAVFGTNPSPVSPKQLVNKIKELTLLEDKIASISESDEPPMFFNYGFALASQDLILRFKMAIYASIYHAPIPTKWEGFLETTERQIRTTADGLDPKWATQTLVLLKLAEAIPMFADQTAKIDQLTDYLVSMHSLKGLTKACIELIGGVEQKLDTN